VQAIASPCSTSGLNLQSLVNCIVCVTCGKTFTKKSELRMHLWRSRNCRVVSTIGGSVMEATDDDTCSISSRIGSSVVESDVRVGNAVQAIVPSCGASDVQTLYYVSVL